MNGSGDFIELDEAIDELRAQLLRAIDRGKDAPIHFPVSGIEIQFHVGVTRAAEGKAGLRFWVVELGGGGSYSEQAIQTVTINLGAPVDDSGRPIQVASARYEKP